MSRFNSRDALLALVALGMLSLGALVLGSTEIAVGFAMSATTLAAVAGGGRTEPRGGGGGDLELVLRRLDELEQQRTPRRRTRTPPRGLPPSTDPHIPTLPLPPDDEGNA